MWDSAARTAARLGIYLVLLGTTWSAVECHGYLKTPPGRSSLWREQVAGAPANYDDNQLNCGGSGNQWSVNDGKCGTCGDPWQGPRENEAGGRYARGIIARTYPEGATIEVTVKITAFHLGWFEFRLCPNNDVTKSVTQECLDRYLLPIEGADEVTRYFPPGRGEDTVKLHLPAGVSCTQCVLQWKWHCGNNWGVDEDTGRGCVGCGRRQEQFYACSDIAITPAASTSPAPPGSATDGAVTGSPDVATGAKTQPDAPTSGLSTPQGARITEPAKESTIGELTTAAAKTPSVTNTTTQPPTTTTTTQPPTTTNTTTPTSPTTPPSGGSVCRAWGAWAGNQAMDRWCVANCAVGYCPEQVCRCAPPGGTPPRSPWDDCVPSPAYSMVPGMAGWCRANCARGFCPATHCACPAT